MRSVCNDQYCCAERSFDLDVGAERVEVATRARVEAEDFTAGGRKRERDAVLLPKRPVSAKVADEGERSYDKVAVELAIVACNVGEALVWLQTNLNRHHCVKMSFQKQFYDGTVY